MNQLEALNLTLTIIENLELLEGFCGSPLYFNWRQNIISDSSGNVYSNVVCSSNISINVTINIII